MFKKYNIDRAVFCYFTGWLTRAFMDYGITGSHSIWTWTTWLLLLVTVALGVSFFLEKKNK